MKLNLWKIIRWFDKWWWIYLFKKPSSYSDAGWLRAIWCRLRNHPAGVWYYNPGGWEPNMRCKNCGDDLG